ncbi:MAG TPA: hypothetical protein VFI76_10095 [Terrimicrobiaceae bacterium]|nr:hypothetical protein [Terrimicrobiaceae bacterium]
MRKFLIATVALLALAMPVKAATITDFGADPTSAGGAFNHSLGSLVGFFSDQYTFTLTQAATLTIASVTNVFAQSSDFISGFNGSVIAGTPALPGATVIGPILASLGCGPIPNCQGFAGSAILAAGSYFLNIEGFANGSSGYGGNLATFAVPEVPLPPAVWLFLTGLIGLMGAGNREKIRAFFTRRQFAAA